jgi:ribosomal-protein-alanine N-acetyltransferase
VNRSLLPFRVLEAGSGDLAEVAALESRAFPIPWKREYFASEIGAPFRFNRVARDASGALAGYVFCSWAAGEIHVNKIATSEAWRRKGVARALMDEVLGLGARVGTEEIYLEVRPSNGAARGFYAELGFSEAGRRPGYYLDGEDAMVMIKRLRAPSAASLFP